MYNIIFGLCKKVRDLNERAHQERVRERESSHMLPNAPAPPPIPVAPASPPPPPLDNYIEQLQQEDYFTQHYGTESSMSYGYVPTQLAGPYTSPLVFASAPTCTSMPASERFAHTAADSILSTLLSDYFALAISSNVTT